MRAVLIATGEWRDAAALAEWYPVPLVPLHDRPLIQHIVEFFARQGIRQYDIVLSHQPEKIEHHLEDGDGVWRSRYHHQSFKAGERSARHCQGETREVQHLPEVFVVP